MTPEKRFVLSHVIKNVSKLDDNRQFTQEEEHHYLPWRMAYRKEGPYFSTYLYCEQPIETKWSVSIKYTVRVVSVNGNSIAKNNKYTINSESVYNGFGGAIAHWDNMIKDYVVDDELILEAHVTILWTIGIEKPRIRNFDDESAKKISDVVLKIDKEKFYVSKLHLAGHSTYFNALFCGQFMEAKQSEVTLFGINPDDFQYFLELNYMDPTLTDSNIEGVTRLADMYDAKHATNFCEKFLMNKSKHSLRTKLRIALRYRLEKLKKQCTENLKDGAELNAAIDPELTSDDIAELMKLISR